MATRMSDPPSSRPDPDPTVRTTEQLMREVGNLEKLMGNLEKILLSRIEAIEQATKVAHDDLVRVPTQVDKAISGFRDVINGQFQTVDQKFANIDHVFYERDKQTAISAEALRDRMESTLAMQEKSRTERAASFALSIDKSEKGTQKAIEDLKTLLYSTTSGLESKLNDLKDRVAAMDTRAARDITGVTARDTGRGEGLGWVVAAIATLAAIISIVFTLGHFAVHAP
jgi:hypothetical protein